MIIKYLYRKTSNKKNMCWVFWNIVRASNRVIIRKSTTRVSSAHGIHKYAKVNFRSTVPHSPQQTNLCYILFKKNETIEVSILSSKTTK